MTGTLNQLIGLTIDKAYFESFDKQLIIKTTDGETITISCWCDCGDGWVDETLNVKMENRFSTVVLNIDA